MDTIAYEFKNALYLNITNRCPANCVFCIKNTWNYKFYDYNLKLAETEPSKDEIIAQLSKYNLSKYKEIVFCGYGEPFMRLNEVKEVCSWLKENNSPPIRVNTIGYLNLIYKRNVLPEIEGLIDSISVSLNTPDEKQYFQLCRPIYGEKTWHEVIKFIQEAKKHIPQVQITFLNLPNLDISKCEILAKELGVQYKIRELLK